MPRAGADASYSVPHGAGPARATTVIMPAELALAPSTQVPLAVQEARDWSLHAFAATILLSFILLVVGMPVISAALVAASSASTLALLRTTPHSSRSRLLPEAIVSLEARQTYRAILGAFAEIERIAHATPSATSMRVIDRCRSAVELCARVAVLGNPIQRYLDGHQPEHLRSELDRLRAHTEVAADERTISDLSRATAARARQLATYEEMRAMRDRIQARLELVHASLESFAAQLLKLQVVEEEDLAFADETVTERIDGISEELDILESTLALDPSR